MLVKYSQEVGLLFSEAHIEVKPTEGALIPTVVLSTSCRKGECTTLNKHFKIEEHMFERSLLKGREGKEIGKE